MISGGDPSISNWTSVSYLVGSIITIKMELTAISIDTFEINRERAIDYLNTRDNVYVFDGYAGVYISQLSRKIRKIMTFSTNSGTPSTGSRSVSFAPEPITHSSWYVCV